MSNGSSSRVELQVPSKYVVSKPGPISSVLEVQDKAFPRSLSFDVWVEQDQVFRGKVSQVSWFSIVIGPPAGAKATGNTTNHKRLLEKKKETFELKIDQRARNLMKGAGGSA